MRSARSRLAAGASLGLLALVGAACVQPPPPPPPPPPTRVVLYGDSISAEIAPRLATDLGDIATVATRVMGGSALCDALDAMTTDASNSDLDVAVIQFSGNTSTPCMAAATTEPDRTLKYVADLATALDRLTADPDRVVLVLSSPFTWSLANAGEPAQDAFNQALATAVADWQTTNGSTTRVRYVDAADEVEDAGGHFTWTKPCLADEQLPQGCRKDGTILVRSPDGNHFCPVAPQVVCPPYYSSGARRYGDRVAAETRPEL